MKRLSDTQQNLETERAKLVHQRLASVPRPVGSASSSASGDEGEEYDLFIAHASEDKDDFVRPFAKKLQNAGLSVWYDEFT